MFVKDYVDQMNLEESPEGKNDKPEEDKFETSITEGLKKYKTENFDKLDLKDKERIE